MRRLALFALVLSLTTAAPAYASPAFSVELRAPAEAEFGARITLRGRITPTLADAQLTIHRNAVAVGTVVTRRDGTFSFKTRVDGPATYEARGGELASAPVAPAVRPRLRARFVGSGVLGAPLRLAARVEPSAALRVVLRRNGRTVVERTYSASARIGIGTRRGAALVARVTVESPMGWAPASVALRRTVVAPRLGLGSRGASVRILELRLRELRYALPRVDGYYGLDTSEAVLAFQKVERLPWTGRVDARVWNRLRRAHPPRARHLGTHIEVSKGGQYLLVVRKGVVATAVHASTGATGNTPLGRWRVYRKVPGWDWVLWYPMYFLRGFAIHGYPSVPAYPASHGCVRVPMWIAPRLYASHGWGSTVYVYW